MSPLVASPKIVDNVGDVIDSGFAFLRGLSRGLSASPVGWLLG